MKRYLTFTYGALSYVVFLSAFLYPIGFVGNLVHRRRTATTRRRRKPTQRQWGFSDCR